MPLDPGREWLAAGITGIPRQREWDAVVVADAPGEPGAEIEFVALPDGRLLTEGGEATLYAAALAGAIETPYRAIAVRREDRWAVGARRIEVARLDPDPSGDDLELTWDGASLALVADGVPVGASRASALERLASGREKGRYAAHAHRLDGDLWEILVLPL
jgi:hypothetical protein